MNLPRLFLGTLVLYGTPIYGMRIAHDLINFKKTTERLSVTLKLTLDAIAEERVRTYTEFATYRTKLLEQLPTNPSENFESFITENAIFCSSALHLAHFLVAFPWKDHISYDQERLAILLKPLITYSQNALNATLNQVVELGGDEEYWTSRRYAIAALVCAGANPGAKYLFGKTILHEAVIHDDADAVALLLTHQAHPNTKGITPLENAKSLRVAQLLVTHGASVTAIPRLLHQVTSWNEYSPALIPFYLEHGADPCTQDEIGNTPLHALFFHNKFSIRDGVFEKATYLLKAAPQLLQMKNKQGHTPREVFMTTLSDDPCFEFYSPQFFTLFAEVELNTR